VTAADDLQLQVTDGKPLLDGHADDVAGGETGSIGKEHEGIVDVTENPGDGYDEDGGLAEAEPPGDGLATAHDEQDAEGIQRHIGDTQQEDQQCAEPSRGGREERPHIHVTAGT
jgi:hypothetical protein